MSIAIIFFGLIFLGVPVAVGLAIAGTAGVMLQHHLSAVIVAARMANSTDSVVLYAIPLFVLTGSLMTAGGIAQRLFRLARVLVGHFNGGLAQVNIAMSVFNAGLSGSSAADAAVDCKVVVPQMVKAGYPAEFSCGITAAGGILANIIPPSIAFLVYASLTDTSVGKLFVAGIVPGLMLAGAMSITAYRTCRRRGYGVRTAHPSWREVAIEFARSGPTLIIPLVVVFGIRLGVFTATEAGGVAAVVALFLGLVVYKDLKLRDLPGVLAQTAVESAVIMLIIAFASPVAWILGYEQIPQHIAEFFSRFSNSALIYLLVVNLLLLAGGAIMEGVSLMILMAPILAPVAAQLGIDPIQFGVVVVVNVVLGAITPPFGQIVFFVSSLTRLKSETIFKEVIRYLPLLFLVLLMVTYIPGLYLWTVGLFGP